LPAILHGSESIQVAALWKYLVESPHETLLSLQTPTSVSALGESDTPVPTERPLLVHGFLPGDAGLRGIALGFPDGIHFAFDAEQCCLSRAWTGPFVHHEGWSGSGKGKVGANALTILGEIVWRDDGSRPVHLDGCGSTLRTRFLEARVTKHDAGFAWELQASDTANQTIFQRPVQIEERLSPARELGPVAFYRRSTISGAPSGATVSVRAMTLPASSASSTTSDVPSIDDWFRVPAGDHEWLIRRVGPRAGETWSLPVSNPPSTGAGRALLLTLTADGHPIELKFAYVRVQKGRQLPPSVLDDRNHQHAANQ
jgi:hypothetical protein